ncbi:hypothetical protein DICPUDRAFT_148419 [Dictyostelium purpureum]|uniref:Uncharacterized protein n=1 Tax=Dictyostelium purpureum TaxID=5786 RepID=F0ZB30_DICPU|nr:uncharacterized protein DICPUDRAFT_148419 [Dictyostelium purpureum]EGC38846.1 hypothetical protein DICPUDRAFT_148419 [Dictyostelium purpureum]|eukprot:XP_003284640.1 hypothetical protein DICPUDRAFT_148419 [Dictyostelium purpureum]
MSIINEKIIFYNNCMADIESKENCLILKEEDIINGHLKTYKKEENKVNQIVFYSSFNMTNGIYNICKKIFSDMDTIIMMVDSFHIKKINNNTIFIFENFSKIINEEKLT